MATIRKLARPHITYYVNEENKTITAVCEDIRDIFHSVVAEIERCTDVYLSNVKFPRKNLKHSHTVTCAPEDEWNEEYGKRIAFNKLFDRRLKSLINTMIEKKLASIVHAENLLVAMLSQPKYKGNKELFDFVADAKEFKKIYKEVKNNG